MEREMESLLAELRYLAEGLKAFGTAEAVMRLRALGELAESLGTDALLNLVAAQVEQADVALLKAA